MAEGVGFEPTEGVTLNGFQDRRFRPLSHPSICRLIFIFNIMPLDGQHFYPATKSP